MKCRTFVFCVAICCTLAGNAQEPQGHNAGIFPNNPVSPYGSAAEGSIFSGLPTPTKSETVSFTYRVNYRVNVQSQTPNGEVSIQPQSRQSVATGTLELDCDLEKLDLPEEAKRAAVQAVTATRHKKLLQSMKEAKTESEKEDAAKKLEANYRAHYAVETEWRTKQLAELEKRLEEMRAQLKERAGSEDKYVEAAMTLAKLHAQGISAEPPKLNGANSQGLGPSQPQIFGGPQAYFPPLPATLHLPLSPNDLQPFLSNRN